MLSAKRDTKAAKRFFKKVLKAKHNQQPRVINVDMDNKTKQKVLDKDSELRQVKYLNNRIEQDHRFIKRLVKLELGFKPFYTAIRIIQGYEIINAIRKGQINSIKKGDILGQKEFIESLFEIAI